MRIKCALRATQICYKCTAGYISIAIYNAVFPLFKKAPAALLARGPKVKYI